MAGMKWSMEGVRIDIQTGPAGAVFVREEATDSQTTRIGVHNLVRTFSEKQCKTLRRAASVPQRRRRKGLVLVAGSNRGLLSRRPYRGDHPTPDGNAKTKGDLKERDKAYGDGAGEFGSVRE